MVVGFIVVFEGLNGLVTYSVRGEFFMCNLVMGFVVKKLCKNIVMIVGGIGIIFMF